MNISMVILIVAIVLLIALLWVLEREYMYPARNMTHYTRKQKRLNKRKKMMIRKDLELYDFNEL